MIITKNQREIDLMREAGRIVALVHQKMAEVVRPGITTLELNAIAEKIILDHGAKPSFKNYNGFPASICTSINEQIVHGIPSKYALKEGDIISIDVGACYKGYHGDSAWTYAVGSISDEAKRVMEATKGSLFAGLAMVKPGNRLSDISHAVEVYLNEHGCTTPLEYTGHGVGSALHEDPAVPNYGAPGRGPRLVEGMTLAIEPMGHGGKADIHILEDHWTAITEDGSLAAHYEHSIVVTKDGYEILTKL
ncbi:type I methionyl aminopeptidase [Beduini massiliensis]|uniref:type I methionyl aminopeptidase n=1 Tax=Beduini massiliensis TaxID=1585974 RepID=UPI00059A7E18|nr:type I methionyl aminopeptidase [Beduini massiliensis]